MDVHVAIPPAVAVRELSRRIPGNPGLEVLICRLSHERPHAQVAARTPQKISTKTKRKGEEKMREERKREEKRGKGGEKGRIGQVTKMVKRREKKDE